jgi:hypothetical protein
VEKWDNSRSGFPAITSPHTFHRQPRRLGDIGGDAPGFVAGQQLGRRTPPRLILEIGIRQRVADVILDDEAGIVRLVDGPGWRG